MDYMKMLKVTIRSNLTSVIDKSLLTNENIDSCVEYIVKTARENCKNSYCCGIDDKSACNLARHFFDEGIYAKVAAEKKAKADKEAKDAQNRAKHKPVQTVEKKVEELRAKNEQLNLFNA